MNILPSNNGVYRWSLINYPKDISKYKAILLFQQAFEIVREDLRPLKFESTKNYDNSEIKIEFDKNYERHGRKEGSLAFGKYPWSAIPGVIVVNDTIEWDYDSLLNTIVHELRHVFGLRHSKDRKCNMFVPKYKTRPLTLGKVSRAILLSKYRKERRMAQKNLFLDVSSRIEWRRFLFLSKEDREVIAFEYGLDNSSTWGIIKAIYLGKS